MLAVLLAETAVISVLQILIPGSPLVLVAPLALLVPVFFLLGHRRKHRTIRLGRISPQDITKPSKRGREQISPEELSNSIVERATEIRRGLEGSPSEVRIEMCALGYRNCANDMITLTHLINQELQKAGFLRRLRLRLCRKRATDALAAARAGLPPGALRAMRQEQQ